MINTLRRHTRAIKNVSEGFKNNSNEQSSNYPNTPV